MARNKNKGNLPYQCKYKQIVGCADLKGCYRCGWNPDVALARKVKLRAKINAKPPTKTRQKKRMLAVTWLERKR